MRTFEKPLLRTLQALALVLIALGAFGAFRFFTKPDLVTIQVPVIKGEGAASAIAKAAGNAELLAQAKKDGKILGCGDSVEYIRVKVPRQDNVIDAAYRALFTGDEIVRNTPYSNPLTVHLNEYAIGDAGPDTSKPLKPLTYERVEIVNGVAAVYLTGEYRSMGACEAPQIQAVLAFAAKRYDPSVQTVRVYINDVEEKFAPAGA